MLAYRQPMPHELREAMPVLAQYRGECTNQGEDEQEDEVWFPCKVIRRLSPHVAAAAAADAEAAGSAGPAPPEFELSWDEGGEHFHAACMELRTFLSHIP